VAEPVSNRSLQLLGARKVKSAHEDLLFRACYLIRMLETWPPTDEQLSKMTRVWRPSDPSLRNVVESISWGDTWPRDMAPRLANDRLSYLYSLPDELEREAAFASPSQNSQPVSLPPAIERAKSGRKPDDKSTRPVNRVGVAELATVNSRLRSKGLSSSEEGEQLDAHLIEFAG
jgi:hypothetical protein